MSALPVRAGTGYPEIPMPASSSRDRLQRALGRATSLLARTRLREQAAAPIRDHLLIEAQQATWRELHRRFTERASRGERGLANALEALDAMWLAIRELRAGAPAVVETLASPHASVRKRLERFYAESTALLEEAIRAVFAEDLGKLAIPPDRMAVLIRIALEGLVVELAQARDDADVARVDQAYADLRGLFERFVILGDASPAVEAVALEPIPLPW